jgi:hypothetical protein
VGSANEASLPHDSSAAAQAGAVAALASCALVAGYAQGVHPVGLVLALVHAAAWLRRRWLPVLVVVDLLLIGWMGAMLAPYGFATRYDTWMHLALVRRVAENGRFPPDAYYHGYPAAPVLSFVHQSRAEWRGSRASGSRRCGVGGRHFF